MSELSWMEACIQAMSEHAWYSGKFSPALRQAALERDLGQIRCPHTHGSWINPDQCPGCGAAL